MPPQGQDQEISQAYMNTPTYYNSSGSAIPTPIPNEAVIENKIRQIGIRQLNHGYIIDVGCQTFAIEKPSDLIAKLSEYINAPAETEKKWQEGKLF